MTAEVDAALDALHDAEVGARVREVVAGVRAWCAINEIAEPPLDWAGLGLFLSRIEARADALTTEGGQL